VLKAVSTCIGFFSGRHAAKFSSAASIPLAQWNIAHKNHMTWYWCEEEKARLWPAFSGINSDRILNAMYAAAISPKPLDQLLSVYQQSWLVEDLLMKADKMSMAASLELRVPFLDYRLVEWANRQNISAKIGSLGGRYITKHLLRRFAEKRLPREITWRPKRGFPVPVYQWFNDRAFLAWSLDHLTGESAKAKYFFVAKEMERELYQAATNSHAAHKAWQLIVLETWLRQSKVDTPADPPALRAHFQAI
jgi:asparagine synthase (glutamine-hydrolysing)